VTAEAVLAGSSKCMALQLIHLGVDEYLAVYS
jgi:hypothetical protein